MGVCEISYLLVRCRATSANPAGGILSGTDLDTITETMLAVKPFDTTASSDICPPERY